MTNDAELIRQTALDYFEGWFDGDVERMDRALHADLVKRSAGDQLGAYREYLHVVRTSEGWKIANTLWRPT